MDRSTAWRAALLQAATVAVAAVILGATLDKAFFEDWGWLAGPGTWALCALVTGAVLRLPLGLVIVGAGLSGIPSLVTVLLGAHWAGAPLAVALFGAWCGWLAARRRRSRRGRPAQGDGVTAVA
jgi:hypothetical protein